MNDANGGYSVLMCPDYSDSNPYQKALIEALADRDVNVTPISATVLFPLLSGCLRHGLPDVIHIHWLDRFVITDRRFKSILVSLLGVRLLFEIVVLRGLGVPTVWTVHNMADHERRAPLIEGSIRHLVARWTDRIIVHCDRAAQQVRSRYKLPERVADRIRVIPHGNFDGAYADDLSRSSAREKLGLDADSTVLLFFGLIRPYKNVPELIETFRTIPDEQARLLIVGNPWNETISEAVRRASNNDDRVRPVLEYVPDEDIQLYQNASDAVVLPFDTVLTSGSAVLAMTFGRGVIAPAIGCLPELIEDDGGILYDPTTPDGLRSALCRAMNHPQTLRRMGQRNRLKADRLDWDPIAARTRDVYRHGSESIHE